MGREDKFHMKRKATGPPTGGAGRFRKSSSYSQIKRQLIKWWEMEREEWAHMPLSIICNGKGFNFEVEFVFL